MRDQRFDCLKLLSMFGIVTIHGIYRSGILEQCDRFSLEWFAISVIYTFFFAMTNVFVLTSAHFMHNKSIRMDKVWNIVLLTTGYSCLIYILLVCIGSVDFSIITFVSCMLSVFTNQYWFIGAYLILYLLTPYINKLLAQLTEQELRKLCFVLFFTMSIIPTFLIFLPVSTLFDADAGKGIIWFVSMYCISFYIKQYATVWIEKVKCWKVWMFLVGNVCALVFSRIVLFYVSNFLGMAGDGETRLYFDSSCFVFAISVSIYILTLKRKPIHLGKNNAWIGSLAGTTLGIYLIHEQPQLKTILWDFVLQCKNSIGSIPAVFLSIVIVYLGSMLIEIVRQKVIKKVRK